MSNILAVDDDPTTLRIITQVLEDSGYEVNSTSSGEDAFEMIARGRPDLVVLDIVMKGMSGLEVCRRIRADPFLAKLPILFLTSKSRSSDVAQGLDAGGDDFLVKPFSSVELNARVRALLRRSDGGALDPSSDYQKVGELTLHSSNFELQVGDRVIELTPIEHRFIHYLMMHAGQPVAIKQLLEDVWEYPTGLGDPKLVRVHVAHLRAKIEPEPDNPRYLRNVRGRGYLIDGQGG